VRDVASAKKLQDEEPRTVWTRFDFADPGTFDGALEGCDRLFLLRPPQLSNVQQYFEPLIRRLPDLGLRQVLFLSVQGAARSKVIPHRKIELLLQDQGLDYIFLRPGYFMQNLSTTLLPDILRRELILPAGKARFNWVDAHNVGEAAAILLRDFEQHRGQALDLTGEELLDFHTVTTYLNRELRTPVQYRSVNPLRFYWIKRRQGLEPGYILVLLLLHFLPRWQRTPPLTTVYHELAGKRPTQLADFIKRELSSFSA